VFFKEEKRIKKKVEQSHITALTTAHNTSSRKGHQEDSNAVDGQFLTYF
jgi:hypothetical protein